MSSSEEVANLGSPVLPVIGLIPAAGRASRLGPLPCSKEIMPLNLAREGDDVGTGPRVACHHLLECFGTAGIDQVFLVLREGKWDIPAYLCCQPVRGVELAYVAIESTGSVPETLSRAQPFLSHSRVALGFPDVLFEPKDAYSHLAQRQEEWGCDVILGLFPCYNPPITDMVDLAPDGRVLEIQVRPAVSDLSFNWLLALWAPRFTAFLAETMARPQVEGKELQLGAVFNHARAAGLDFRGVRFPDGYFLDIGTVEGYAEALRSRCPSVPSKN